MREPLQVALGYIWELYDQGENKIYCIAWTRERAWRGGGNADESSSIFM